MFRTFAVVVVGAGVLACSSPTAPAVCDISNPTPVALSVGDYASFSVCAVTFPANASTDSSEYLVLAQAGGGSPGATAAFDLRAITAASPSVVSPAITAARTAQSGGALAAQFDRYLRGLERAPAVVPPGERLPAAASLAASAPPQVVIPQLGASRTFKHVCANLGCTAWDTVTGVVKALSGHVAIYVDSERPGDLSQADLDSLALIFDQHVYVVDTTAFGREPDIDNNGVVIALLSGAVNGLSNPATCFTTGYVAGFFFSADLDLQVSSLYDNGEIMYGLVADTNGIYSCKHTVSAVKRLLPSTFLHEFEHMINYTQHVRVRRGNAEDIWLDEALANYAQELGGRSFLPDTVTFNKYVLDDLNDAYEYLTAPQDHFLLSPTDQNLPDDGAGWMYVRYLTDQYGDAVTYKLVNTSSTGTTNIFQQTNLPFSSSAALWSLANWVSDLDLPGFTAPLELQYRSWQFRKAFASLHAQDTTGRYPLAFPLEPIVSAGSQLNISGTLRGGSGPYVRVIQPPTAGTFTLTFTGPFSAPLPSAVLPHLVVLRLR